MKKHILILITFLLVSFIYSQIPIEEYRTEIEKLETEKQINAYWNKLHKIDQEILLSTSNSKKYDSISISNMIKTVLIFDCHGTKGYNRHGFSGFLPIITLSHNQIGLSQIAYWAIIEKCKEIGGVIDGFGGKYPAYELESVSITFYNYSVFNQEEKYPWLLNKLSEIKTENIIETLIKSFEYQNELRKLKIVSVLNSWYLQTSQNRKEEEKFSIVKMSDNNLYLKQHGRIQKLELVQAKEKTKKYLIENEPFGWNYVYGEDGSLCLIDNQHNELIRYTLAK